MQIHITRNVKVAGLHVPAGKTLEVEPEDEHAEALIACGAARVVPEPEDEEPASEGDSD